MSLNLVILDVESCVPFLPVGEEGIWVLGVELEGLANIRPAHGTRWQWKTFMLMVMAPLEKLKGKQKREYNSCSQKKKKEEEKRRRQRK